MAHVSFSKVLQASPASAWDVVRDFGSLPRWFPFVTRSELRGGGPHDVGTIRANTIESGAVVEERLLELSERDRRIVYEIVAGDVPTENYSATLRVHAVTADPRQCFVEWIADFDVDGDREPVIEWVRDGIFKTCLEELERVITASSPALATDETRQNHGIVRAAFDAWTAGGTNFFDILAEDAVWTIAGSGPSAQTFHGRQAFLDGGYGPIAGRFASAMKPKVLGIYADGDEVVIRWDGASQMKDGQTYRNSYAWFFRMRGAKVVNATAFLDLPTYDAALQAKPLPVWRPDRASAVPSGSKNIAGA